MSVNHDPVERDTNRYHDEQAAYEQWYEAFEEEMAGDFFDKYGVGGLDQKMFQAFVDSRWQARGL